jgi:hypothetical protein
MTQNTIAAQIIKRVQPLTPRRAKKQEPEAKINRGATSVHSDQACPGAATRARLRIVMERNDGVSQMAPSPPESPATNAARARPNRSFVSQQTAQARPGPEKHRQPGGAVEIIGNKKDEDDRGTGQPSRVSRPQAIPTQGQAQRKQGKGTPVRAFSVAEQYVEPLRDAGLCIPSHFLQHNQVPVGKGSP